MVRDFLEESFSLMEHVHLILQEILIQNIHSFFGLKFKCQNAFKPTQGFLGLLTDGGHKSPLPKICHTYPTMMKLFTVIPYQKKI